MDKINYIIFHNIQDIENDHILLSTWLIHNKYNIHSQYLLIKFSYYIYNMKLIK